MIIPVRCFTCGKVRYAHSDPVPLDEAVERVNWNRLCSAVRVDSRKG